MIDHPDDLLPPAPSNDALLLQRADLNSVRFLLKLLLILHYPHSSVQAVMELYTVLSVHLCPVQRANHETQRYYPVQGILEDIIPLAPVHLRPKCIAGTRHNQREFHRG